MTGKNDAYSYSIHPNHTVWTSSKVFLLHPFSCCLNSFLASFVGDALHFQTVASTPKHAFSTPPQWQETARGFSGGNNGWPRADPRITGWRRACASWSPKMLAQVQWKRQHPQFRITCCCEFWRERKSMNQSPNKKDKKRSFGEDSLNCFLIWNKKDVTRIFQALHSGLHVDLVRSIIDASWSIDWYFRGMEVSLPCSYTVLENVVHICPYFGIWRLTSWTMMSNFLAMASVTAKSHQLTMAPIPHKIASSILLNLLLEDSLSMISTPESFMTSSCLKFPKNFRFVWGCRNIQMFKTISFCRCLPPWLPHSRTTSQATEDPATIWMFPCLDDMHAA